MHFVVLCSTRGTVFEATLERIADGSLTATCLGLITDRADHGCLEVAKKFNVPVEIIERKKGEDREQYDQQVHASILKLTEDKHEPRTTNHEPLIACMGWMYILSPWFIAQWRNKILNVHPALLPKHTGAHAHENVLKSGDRISGMTIHLIDEGVDTGPMLLQKECPVEAGDTVDTLKARVQMLEKEWFPKVLQSIERGEMKLPS